MYEFLEHLCIRLQKFGFMYIFIRSAYLFFFKMHYHVCVTQIKITGLPWIDVPDCFDSETGVVDFRFFCDVVLMGFVDFDV